jgi:hypothetical protein
MVRLAGVSPSGDLLVFSRTGFEGWQVANVSRIIGGEQEPLERMIPPADRHRGWTDCAGDVLHAETVRGAARPFPGTARISEELLSLGRR